MMHRGCYVRHNIGSEREARAILQGEIKVDQERVHDKIGVVLPGVDIESDFCCMSGLEVESVGQIT